MFKKKKNNNNIYTAQDQCIILNTTILMKTLSPAHSTKHVL